MNAQVHHHKLYGPLTSLDITNNTLVQTYMLVCPI